MTTVPPNHYRRQSCDCKNQQLNKLSRNLAVQMSNKMLWKKKSDGQEQEDGRREHKLDQLLVQLDKQHLAPLSSECQFFVLLPQALLKQEQVSFLQALSATQSAFLQETLVLQSAKSLKIRRIFKCNFYIPRENSSREIKQISVFLSIYSKTFRKYESQLHRSTKDLRNRREKGEKVMKALHKQEKRASWGIIQKQTQKRSMDIFQCY